MYIAYSALQNPLIAGEQRSEHDQSVAPDNELSIRYQAYQHICSKYRREIAAIQQHIPNWQPTPPTL